MSGCLVHTASIFKSLTIFFIFSILSIHNDSAIQEKQTYFEIISLEYYNFLYLEKIQNNLPKPILQDL